jgi:hypothetical protein
MTDKNSIRAAFATIANNTSEEHTRKFALEMFNKMKDIELDMEIEIESEDPYEGADPGTLGP